MLSEINNTFTILNVFEMFLVLNFCVDVSILLRFELKSIELLKNEFPICFIKTSIEAVLLIGTFNNSNQVWKNYIRKTFKKFILDR